MLDVGSFLGIYATLAARLAGPRGHVVAVEPTPWSAAVARRHTEFNRDPSAAAVMVVEAAVGDAPGQRTFYEYHQPYVNALEPAVDVDGPAETRTVRVLTIDDLCEEMQIRPTFVRMDVQGAEFQALAGARRTIAAAGTRLTIVAEMHPQCWPAFGMNPVRARQTFEALDLSAEPLQPGADLFTRDGHIILRKRR